MKYHLSLLIGILLTLNAHAVTVEIFGKKRNLLFSGESQIALPSTVGPISIALFEAYKIPYQGGDYGIARIFDLEQDVEVISNTEMKAYGWCFAIDGVAPQTMPHQTPVQKQNSKIVWYYAYAYYKNGKWLGQCLQDKI